MTYDSWKTTDPAMEQAGRAEEALDQYEQDVHHALTRYAVWAALEFTDEASGIMQSHRDRLFDWMNDNVLPADAALLIIEGDEVLNSEAREGVYDNSLYTEKP